MDVVMDSVSVATTFQKTLAERGIIFCPISEAIQKHPDLVRKYLGTVVPKTDNFYAALNSAVFSDGSFCENQDEAYGETEIKNCFALEFDGFEFLLTKSKYGLLEDSALWSSIYDGNMQVLSDFLNISDNFTVVGNIYEDADLIENKEQSN